MASRTVLHDDLDGSEAQQTVEFSLEGRHYEIDLKDEHVQQLRDSLGRFIGAARVVTHGRATAPRAPRGTAAREAAATKEELARIRHWAREHGHHVADRGRIPEPIREAYRAAHRHH